MRGERTNERDDHAASIAFCPPRTPNRDEILGTGFRAGRRVASCLPRADLDQVLRRSSPRRLRNHAFVLCAVFPARVTWERERERTIVPVHQASIPPRYSLFVSSVCGFFPRYCDRFDSEGRIDRCLLRRLRIDKKLEFIRKMTFRLSL